MKATIVSIGLVVLLSFAVLLMNFIPNKLNSRYVATHHCRFSHWNKPHEFVAFGYVSHTTSETWYECDTPNVLVEVEEENRR